VRPGGTSATLPRSSSRGPPLVPGMSAVQHRQDQGGAPTPSREPMPRGRWDEVIHQGGDLQASSDPQKQGPMGYGTHLLHSHGPEAPPVVTGRNRLRAQYSFLP